MRELKPLWRLTLALQTQYPVTPISAASLRSRLSSDTNRKNELKTTKNKCETRKTTTDSWKPTETQMIERITRGASWSTTWKAKTKLGSHREPT